MVDDYTIDKLSDKIKRIDNENLDDTRILIDTDDELPNDTLKSSMTLMTCVIKDGDKFYPQLFFGYVFIIPLFVEKGLPSYSPNDKLNFFH